MAINFNTALGIHPQALMLREKRSEILAANLANADTPDYKARDLDFKSILEQKLGGGSGSPGLNQTREGHMAGKTNVLGADLLYRNPMQASLDGNTVEEHIEQAKYAQNAMQYQASLQFVSGDFLDLRSALRGE